MEPAAILPLPTEVHPETACVPIAGEAPVLRALRTLLHRVAASRVVVVAAEPVVAAVAEIVGPTGAAVVTVGSAADWERAILAGLEHLDAQPLSPVLVHDWRHPLVPPEVTDRVLAELQAGHRVVVPVTAVTDSVKEIDADRAVVSTVDRATLRNVQYPRGFAVAALADLLARGADPVTAALTAGEPVTTVDGHADAGRFALPGDTALLAALIATRR